MSLFSNLGHAVFVVLTMLLKFQTCLIVAPHPHMWEFKGMLRIFMAPNCKTMTTVLTETWQCDHSLASHLSVTVTITNNFHHGNNSQLAKLLPWQQIIPVAAILTRAKIVRDTAVAVCLITIIVSQRVGLHWCKLTRVIDKAKLQLLPVKLISALVIILLVYNDDKAGSMLGIK